MPKKDHTLPDGWEKLPRADTGAPVIGRDKTGRCYIVAGTAEAPEIIYFDAVAPAEAVPTPPAVSPPPTGGNV